MSILGTCSSCCHWVPQKTNGGVPVGVGPTSGECHCHPPSVHLVMTPNGPMIQTQFPLPHSLMWCGEYQPKGKGEAG